MPVVFALWTLTETERRAVLRGAARRRLASLGRVRVARGPTIG